MYRVTQVCLNFVRVIIIVIKQNCRPTIRAKKGKKVVLTILMRVV